MDCLPLKHPNFLFNKIDNETKEKIIKIDSQVILGYETPKNIVCQWYMISKPNHPLFLDAFKECLKNLNVLQTVENLKNNPVEYEKIVLENSGPTLFNRFVKKYQNIIKLPMEYFCAGSIIKGKRKQKITKNSLIKHLFNGSWR